MSGIRGSVRLHSSIKELLQNAFNTTYQLPGKGYDYYRAIMDKECEKLKITKTNILFNTLKRCDMVALVLPEYQCCLYQRTLRQEKNVFVGKESYLDLE